MDSTPWMSICKRNDRHTFLQWTSQTKLIARREPIHALAWVSRTHSQSRVCHKADDGNGNARTYRDDRSASLCCNRDQMSFKVMVTSKIATDLDRGTIYKQQHYAGKARADRSRRFCGHDRTNSLLLWLRTNAAVEFASGSPLLRAPTLNPRLDSSLNCLAWTNIRAPPPFIWCDHPPAFVFHRTVRWGGARATASMSYF